MQQKIIKISKEENLADVLQSLILNNELHIDQVIDRDDEVLVIASGADIDHL